MLLGDEGIRIGCDAVCVGDRDVCIVVIRGEILWV